MKKIIYLFAAFSILQCGCTDNGTDVPEDDPKPQLIELTGSVDGVATLEKSKAFYLYALLAPGDEWTAFYIDKDNAALNTDGTVTMSKEYFWPEEDNTYRFIGVMNSADQTQPILDMEGPVVGLTAGSTPEADLLLSNNLIMQRSSVDDEMEFRHVMTQVVFEMVVDDDNTETYSLTGHVANAGKTAATYSALARPTVDVATVAADAGTYSFDLELATTGTERSPRKIYYLIPDGSDLAVSLTNVKLNGNNDQDIPLVTEDGEPVSLKSGTNYTVKLHVTEGLVDAVVEIGSWVEENLGDQNANIALSNVKWAVTYPEGFDKITKVEIIDNSDRSYFATLDSNGNTQCPVDLPSSYKDLAVWLGNLRVELQADDYTLADDKLDIKVIFVGTAEKLASIAADATTLAGKYRQVAHIDLGTGGGHTPIGSETAPFTGVYDGGGYTLTNFRFATPAAYSGLFGYNSGTIKNVTIAKTTVDGVMGNSGSICGKNNAAGTIENCVNYADMKSTTGTAIGGIVGVSAGTVMENTNYGTISCTGAYIGGVVGDMSGGAAALSILSKNINHGDVLAANNMGGIVGRVGDYCSVSECRNEGSVKEVGTTNVWYVGGIAGAMNGANSSVSKCVNTADLNTFAYYYAGIVGYVSTGGSLTDNVNSGDIHTTHTGGNRLGGISGTVINATVTGNKNTGDITGMGYTAGGIIGQSETSVIENCENSGMITTNSNGGGIVGTTADITGSTITGCVNKNDVNTRNTSADVNTGGIIGYANGAAITGNVNIGSVTSNGGRIGGISGNSAGGTINISLCVNTGAVTGTVNVGGISGGGGAVNNITACQNEGAVTSTSTATWAYGGGVVGQASGNTTVTACSNVGTVSGYHTIGGVAGYVVGGGKVIACYSIGDVTRTSGSESVFGGVAGYNYSSWLHATYWAGNVVTNSGVGQTYTSALNENTKFGEGAWPTEATHDGWKLSSNGGYWESLGEWDAVNPVYPTLAGLPEIPQP